MMLEALPQPIVFAHRGASAYAPENTLAAFELALAHSADAIELDVKLSADGHAVVIHDATVERTTGAHGRVKDLSLAQLRALDAGSFMAAPFHGEKIPMLEEVFEAVGGRTLINVELTNYDSPGDHLVETVCMLVKKFNLQKQIMFSSFHASNLKKARGLLPDVPRGLLAINDYRGVWVRSFVFAFGNFQALHPHLENTSLQQVKRVHRLRRRVHVWTVNEENDIRRLFRWGVDGVFTDDPRLAVQIRGSK
jgi:glycerophosphoryl diester phosphodiesterase